MLTKAHHIDEAKGGSKGNGALNNGSLHNRVSSNPKASLVKDIVQGFQHCEDLAAFDLNGAVEEL